MHIKSVELKKTAFLTRDLIFDDLPKIVFLGRSNVGKSSLINKILNRKRMAKTSSMPGKTISVNYFLINGHFYFIDLPGYGYARISKSESRRAADLISWFLMKMTGIDLAVVLIDCRRGFTRADGEILEKLIKRHFKILTVLTKSDKIGFSELNHRKKELLNHFGLEVVSFSTKSNENRVQLLKYISSALKLKE